MPNVPKSLNIAVAIASADTRDGYLGGEGVQPAQGAEDFSKITQLSGVVRAQCGDGYICPNARNPFAAE